jgi:hypothetical protein
LSPDASALAFVDVDSSAGVRYVGRVVSLSGAGGGTVTAQALAAGTQQLGPAWRPGDAAPTFGTEPVGTLPGGVAASSLSAGFDIPKSFSPDGRLLAAESYSGASFADPGNVSLTLVTDQGRIPIPNLTRFFGWAVR